MSRTYRNHTDRRMWIWGDKIGRDRKPRNKPPKFFKKIKSSIERAKSHQAMRQGQFEAFPRFRKTNEWEYT